MLQYIKSSIVIYYKLPMYSKVLCETLRCINGVLTYVEADSSNGLPNFLMVGNLASSVKEAGDRVKTALKNSNVEIPAKKVTINIAPADIRKDGTAFDLPIAVAILKSLASNGVLFLDELPHFSKMAIETLREPLEEKSIRISRLQGSFTYPANFMLVAAMKIAR